MKSFLIKNLKQRNT